MRALCVGGAAAVALNLVMAYNDYYLYNSLLVGTHFPVISIAFVAFLALVVNTSLRRWRGRDGFSAGELLLIWGIIGVAGGIGSAGIMRYFPSWAVAPAYYTTASNEYAPYILDHLPSWMVVSKDPGAEAVVWFMEGLPRGGRIPWEAWAAPMTAWGIFMLLLYAANFALVAVFYQQWAVRERLIFPLVHLPVEAAEPPARGRLLNAFFANRLTWIGVAVPCVLWGINGLEAYVPGIPGIPTSFWLGGFFSELPWKQFSLQSGKIFLSVVGLTFLLNTQMAFSLWGFYVLFRLSYVLVAWMGSAGGIWAGLSGKIQLFETGGCIIALAGFLVWTARRHLAGWLQRARRGSRDPELDPMAPRLGLALIVAGIAGMVGWYMLAGASWWSALFAVGIFLAVILVFTRLVTEAGLMFVHTKVNAMDLLTGLAPPAWLKGGTLGTLLMHKAVLMFDVREILMPFLMNGLRACGLARVPLSRVLAVFGAVAVVSLGVSAYGRIATSYKYGGVNMDQWANVWSPTWFLDEVTKYQRNPPAYDFTKIGDTPVLPVNVVHVAIGAGATIFMLVMRARFLWWPLHPVGLVMCGAWAMEQIWFSIFLGWAAKACVMTFGGAAVYRRVLPLFLGLVLGECLIISFWCLLGLFTGVPGLVVLPN